MSAEEAHLTQQRKVKKGFLEEVISELFLFQLELGWEKKNQDIFKVLTMGGMRLS